MEVPEIKDGLVEIKTISREPGDRTKIAVSSKDKDIDPVGTCIGVKGTRIKSLVRELGKEKIDIIAWDEDIETYVKNALSPAKIKKVIPKDKLISVFVDDDQLSLAIGKKGQNVRLASKLIGREINIATKEEDKYSKDAEKIKQLLNIGQKTAENLCEAGYRTMKDLQKANVEELFSVPGVGKKMVSKILLLIEQKNGT
jgi:N utilization substance protein A